MKKITLIIVGVLILVGLFFVFKGMTGNAIGSPEDIITISVSEITEEAKWYEYDFNGKKISFFAVRASDGSIRTAFDACDVCYGSKKGYSQQGNQMVCNNCGNRYPIDGLGTENLRGGGCWPGYLPSRIEGDSLIILKEDLEAGGYRF